MPSTYSSNIAVELPADGEKTNTWGQIVNANMSILDRILSQVGSIALTGTTYTLTTSTSGSLTEGHYSLIKFTGSPGGTCTVTISPSSIQRIYTIYNASDETVTMTQGSGGNVSIAAGAARWIYCDGAGSGAAVVDITTLLPIDAAGVSGALDVTSLAIGGTTVTATAAELNILDGVTATAAELNILSGATVTAAELNVLDGVTATVTEINYVDGVTSNIQTQLDALDTGKQDADAEILKANTDDNLTAGYTATADDDGTQSTGTYTPAPSGGNLKHIVNGGAFTLAAPTATGDYTLVIQMTNNASAGVVTVSGFTKQNGESLTTTDGDDFFLFITKINGFTSLTVQALQ